MYVIGRSFQLIQSVFFVKNIIYHVRGHFQQQIANPSPFFQTKKLIFHSSLQHLGIFRCTALQRSKAIPEICQEAVNRFGTFLNTNEPKHMMNFLHKIQKFHKLQKQESSLYNSENFYFGNFLGTLASKKTQIHMLKTYMSFMKREAVELLDHFRVFLGVSLNGDTPPKHPNMFIFSRKTPWLLGKPTILGTPHMIQRG